MSISGDVAKGPGWELRCGRYQDALADVPICDSVITDPPYDERTHAAAAAVARAEFADGNTRQAIPYEPWGQDQYAAFVDAWSGLCRGWFVCITSHALAPTVAEAMGRNGRYVFVPLPFVAPGSRVRLAGDGPSNWTCWIVVSRPRSREWQTWGTLPGAYIGPPESMPIIGGKPLWLMRALVRDYSRPGDLIVDPCAGAGTTLLSAAIEGRRGLGAEMDPDTYNLAARRLRAGYTPAMI